MSRLRNVSAALLCFGSLGGIAGCGSPEGQGMVTGTVTLDEAPLAEGVVRFVAVDGDSPTASAPVTKGKFVARLPVGQMRVSFSAPKVVGTRQMYDTPDSPVVDVVEELLPGRYNVRSELTLDVEQGSQEVSFPLESQ